LEINLPDYTVNTLDSVDCVEIPGGSMLMEKGLPQVSTYITMVPYPAGYQIQNVELAAYSGLITAFGLNLPVHESWFAVVGCMALAVLLLASAPTI
jgi:hypothetical protein